MNEGYAGVYDPRADPRDVVDDDRELYPEYFDPPRISTGVKLLRVDEVPEIPVK